MADQGDKVTETVDHFCARHSIGRTTFYRMVKEKQIRVVKLGRRTLVPSKESERLLSHLLGTL